jgi:toxin secretion/phage lysis holin
MEIFLKWFFAFMSEMLQGYTEIILGLWGGLKRIFNIPNYIAIFKQFSPNFTVTSWILAVLALVLVAAIYVLLIVLIAARLDILLNTTIVRDAVVIAFCANEAISIVENAGLMGVPIPAALRRAIEALDSKGNEGGEDE